MGRHSAAEDDDTHGATPDLAVLGAAMESQSATEPMPSVGRHADVGVPTDQPGRPSAPKEREGGTHADLRLLREHPALRARCAAGVIVPFLLYTVVLVVIARTDVYLVWVWIPTVLAGVLLGSFLDQAHRHANR